jgi:hypothetical protein
MGDLERAERYCERSARMLQDTLGEDDPGVLSTRLNLADIRLARGLSAEVEEEIRHCLAGMRAQWGDDHWNTAMARFTLGLCLAAQGRRSEAERQVDASLPVLIDGNKTPQGLRITVIERAIGVFEKWKRASDADRYRRLLDEKDS